MGSKLTHDDRFLFHQGTHHRMFAKLGAHRHDVDGVPGFRFAVWAPNAMQVHLIGDMNQWTAGQHLLHRNGEIWEIWVPDARVGHRYKYRVIAPNGTWGDKADPYGFRMENPPNTASIVWDLGYEWNDGRWMGERAQRQAKMAPVSVYEIHLGSWKRKPNGDFLSYREVAQPLITHVHRMGFTHVELMPVMEHPFYGSWGYQVSGYFSPTHRYGSPQDLMWLIEQLHQANIGVILDWVPGHFPSDAHGLGYFDGTHLYEHADPRLGYHPEWNSLIFNFGRPEVKSFLISSAWFWLELYHADGLRIDGVASMLYRDYARKEGEWLPNAAGGRENPEAAELLAHLNQAVHERFPDVLIMAEDSTAWPKVTSPASEGGLGFDLKWDMGWMHDSLKYMALDPIYRRAHHQSVTFRSVYAFKENFILPLSHDEVVHGKRSIPDKMHGDVWQKMASVRLLYGWMFAQPGRKLLFMGCEFGQWREWNHDRELDWGWMAEEANAGVFRWVCELGQRYRETPAFHEGDGNEAGFRWVNGSDADRSVVTFLRLGVQSSQTLLFVFNFTPIPRPDYWIGAPMRGRWVQWLNSDDPAFGGGGVGNPDGVDTDDHSCDGLPHRLRLTLPPLGMLVLRHTGPRRTRRKK